MPSDDVIVKLRQVAGYPLAAAAQPGDTLLIQQGGLGGPYASISPADLVGTAMADGGDMVVRGKLTAFALDGGSLAFSNGTFGLLSAQTLCAFKGSINGDRIATQTDLNALWCGTVLSFNMRRGHVMLELGDIVCAGGAPIYSPRFLGQPRALTPAPWSNSTRLATTEFVHRNTALYLDNLLKDHPFVFSFNGRTGDVVLTPEDLAGAEAALLNSPIFTGDPTAPTPPPGDNDNSLATTAFVTAAIALAVGNLESSVAATYAPLNNPQFTGQPSAPTAAPGTNSGQLATTAYVMAAVAASTAGVSSFNGRTGVVDLTGNDVSNAGGALLMSPGFLGTPTAPTAAPGANTAQIATCSWVLNEIGGANIGVMSFNGRGGAVILNTSDITGAGGAPLVSANLSGVPTAPTAATGTSTNQIATTAFVEGAIGANAVTSFNGRTGAITLLANDISAAGGAPAASPTFTGVPLAPTAVAGTTTQQLATTAFVAAALAAVSGVLSFNGRTGAVTLGLPDITGAGGAPLASPIFTGQPAGPTAGPGTSTTQLATTAFVTAAIAAGAAGPSNAAPLMAGVAAAGSSALFSRGDHVHPTDTSRAAASALASYLPLAGGVVTGNFNVNGATARFSFFASPQGTLVGVYNNIDSMNYQPSSGLVTECTTNPALSCNKIGSNGNVVGFFQGATACGSISVANGATTAYNTTSDGRLKIDRKPFDAGPVIDAIEVWDFKWLLASPRDRAVFGDVRGHGVIAQDAVTVFPEAIFHDEEKDTWGADYSKFVPLLIREIQMLRARVAQLEARP